jgi:hypothetical protein
MSARSLPFSFPASLSSLVYVYLLLGKLGKLVKAVRLIMSLLVIVIVLFRFVESLPGLLD